MCIRNARTRATCEQHSGWTRREEAAMAADIFTVTYLILGGLYPREKNTTCWGRVSDDTLARYAPDGAFAFIRSDRGGVTYIDGEVLSVDRLVLLGKLMLAEKIVADGAVYAVRIKDTRLWAPYYLIDRVVTTSR